MNEAEIYWLKQLAGSEEVPALPADRPRRLGHSSAGARLYTTLDRSLSANLAALSAREGCTLSMTLLAAYQVLIHQLTSVEESVVIMPAAGQSLNKMGAPDRRLRQSAAFANEDRAPIVIQQPSGFRKGRVAERLSLSGLPFR